MGLVSGYTGPISGAIFLVIVVVGLVSWLIFRNSGDDYDDDRRDRRY